MSKILVKNAKLTNDEIVDILIENGTILRIDNNIAISEIDKIIDINGEKYVSAGWIDMHTHCFNKFKLYSDNPDEIGYKKGVTTVVDAGTSGADTVREFYEKIQSYKTNVYAFLNIAKQGISSQNELSDLSKLDISAVEEAYKKYSDFIVGIKARMSKSVVGNAGLEPLKIAINACEKIKMPLMVHIGSEPPILKEVIEALRPGDIVSHIFNGKKNGIISEDKKIKQCILDANNNGIYFDLAHGTDSFNFKVSQIAKENLIESHVISTDIYERNRINGPVFDLATTMNKALYIGYDLNSVVDKVTRIPAKILGITSVGELKAGYKGDLTIFDIVTGEKELIDSNNEKVIIDKFIKPVGVLLNEEYIELG